MLFLIKLTDLFLFILQTVIIDDFNAYHTEWFGCTADSKVQNILTFLISYSNSKLCDASTFTPWFEYCLWTYLVVSFFVFFFTCFSSSHDLTKTLISKIRFNLSMHFLQLLLGWFYFWRIHFVIFLHWCLPTKNKFFSNKNSDQPKFCFGIGFRWNFYLKPILKFRFLYFL